MRLWSMHPRYFDRQALTACWREGLLAQAVITKPGRGYSRHPQLQRFQRTDDPRAAIARWQTLAVPDAHPCFIVSDGLIADWEKGQVAFQRSR